MMIHKTLSLTDVSLKMEGDAGTFTGYASVFGGVDSYGDTILKGAFVDTLKENGSPKMFFNHRWDLPIGKWTSLVEDDVGLLVSGEFTPGLSLSADVRASMKHGTIDGLSIGGFLSKNDYQETEAGGRIITKWTRLMEISPVAFPADGNARIDMASVKGEELADAIKDIETVRDFERFLRDAGGLSKGAAVSLVARAKAVFSGEGDPAKAAEVKALNEIEARIARIVSMGER